MIRVIALAAALAVVGQAATAQSAQSVEQAVPASLVHLRGLDTLAGKTVDIELPVGSTIRFGRLEIIAEACRVPRDDPNADAFAFLQIRDVREETPRFSGWMFASSPALSSLDHPRYDVWVTRCNNA